MADKLKIKTLKNVIPHGTPVPVAKGVDAGNSVGLWVEKHMKDKGFPINKGKGPDLPGMELKSRKKGTRSAMSLGNMTTKDIIDTPWEKSAIKEKIKRIALVNWDSDVGEVTGVDQIDTVNDDCQAILKDGYEASRSAITSNTDIKYGGGIYLERKKGENWQLRANTTGLRRLKDASAGQAVLNNKDLFPDD